MSAADAVRDRLRDQPLPGEAEATARSWPVVEAALAERSGAAAAERSTGARAGLGSRRSPAGLRSRRALVRVAVAAALLAAVLAAALSPAGAAVGDWIGDRFTAHDARSAPAFATLPKGGSVIALSRTGAYAVRPDGSTRHLGAFSDAGWSPHGLHVVGTECRRLVAVDPAAGAVKWMLTSRGRVSHPAWSTADGFAVAYLEGRALKVVAGNGDPTTNRVVRRDAAPVTPAWRPHSDQVLTYATTGGALVTLDTVTGRMIARSPAAESLERPRSIAWLRGGRRLVALSSHSLTLLDAAGHVQRTVPLAGVARAMAVHPSGKRVAVVVGRRVLGLSLAGGSPRQLFQGNVDGIAWSQDGRRLLLGWRSADQWLLLGPGGRIRALHDVSSELGASGGFPRVAGWCCAG
jgi:hypothetical protein